MSSQRVCARRRFRSASCSSAPSVMQPGNSTTRAKCVPSWLRRSSTVQGRARSRSISFLLFAFLTCRLQHLPDDVLRYGGSSQREREAAPPLLPPLPVASLARSQGVGEGGQAHPRDP